MTAWPLKRKEPILQTDKKIIQTEVQTDKLKDTAIQKTTVQETESQTYQRNTQRDKYWPLEKRKKQTDIRTERQRNWETEQTTTWPIERSISTCQIWNPTSAVRARKRLNKEDVFFFQANSVLLKRLKSKRLRERAWGLNCQEIQGKWAWRFIRSRAFLHGKKSCIHAVLKPP